MIAVDIVVSKLADIADRLSMVRKHRLDAPERYAAHPEARDLVAFNLMLAVQSAADIAMHVVTDSGWPPARSVAESFDRLAEHGLIAAGLAANLRAATAFRNVVAHGYIKLDLAGLHRAANSGVADLELFSQQLAAWTAAQAGSG